MNGPPNPTVPDLLLEQFRLGELPERETLALRRLIDSDQDLQHRLATLEISEMAILENHPAHEMASNIRARLASEATPARDRGARALWLVPAAAVLVLLAIGLPPLLEPPRSEPTGRLKGAGPMLVVYRKIPAGSEALEPGAVVREGDLLRVGYRAAGRRFGVIVSVDGLGVVTQHLPISGSQAIELNQEGNVLLDFSFELDDAPGWERFYLVTADGPFAVAAVKAAATSQPPAPDDTQPTTLDLPRDLAQTVFALRKEPR